MSKKGIPSPNQRWGRCYDLITSSIGRLLKGLVICFKTIWINLNIDHKYDNNVIIPYFQGRSLRHRWRSTGAPTVLLQPHFTRIFPLLEDPTETLSFRRSLLEIFNSSHICYWRKIILNSQDAMASLVPLQ